VEDEASLRGKLAVSLFAGVMLPHVVVVVAGVLLFFAWPPG
jgi:hypothetical protein